MKEFLLKRIVEFNLPVAITAAIFGTALFIIFLYACYKNYGITKSISILFYFVKPWWLFQAFMWTAIFCILLIGQNTISLIVCLMFFIMTCNPTVNGGNIYFIPHMIGATSAIIIGLISIPLMYGGSLMFVPVTSLIATISVLFLKNKLVLLKNCYIYTIEIICLSLFLIGHWIGLITILAN